MPKVKSEGAPSSILGCAIGGIIVAVLALAILYPFRQAPAQSLDVWSRAAWMFANAKNEQVFPPKAELCAAPSCRRVDTEPKYVGGNPGHRSETTLPFCPEHTSEPLPCRCGACSRGVSALLRSNDNRKDEQRTEIEATAIPPAVDQQSARSSPIWRPVPI
jgi:hypothetical protein